MGHSVVVIDVLTIGSRSIAPDLGNVSQRPERPARMLRVEIESRRRALRAYNLKGEP